MGMTVHETCLTDAMYDFLTTNQSTCKCGHRILVGQDRLICKYCGNYVYKNKKIELKYKLLEKGIKVK